MVFQRILKQKKGEEQFHEEDKQNHCIGNGGHDSIVYELSTVAIQYEYETDLDKAYDDLKKEIDAIQSDLPSEADTPVVMELDTSSSADMTLVVKPAGRGKPVRLCESGDCPGV